MKKKIVDVSNITDEGRNIKYRVFDNGTRTDFLSSQEAVAWAVFCAKTNTYDRPIYIAEVIEKALFIVQRQE